MRIAPFAVLIASAAACASVPEKDTAPPPEEPIRVFVEAVMMDVPRDQLGSLGDPSFRELAQQEHAVFASPHVISEDGQSSELWIGSGVAKPQGSVSSFELATWRYRFLVIPFVQGDNVELDVELQCGDSKDNEIATTVRLDNGQRAILPTRITEGDRVLVLMLEPHIVRSTVALRQIMNRITAKR